MSQRSATETGAETQAALELVGQHRSIAGLRSLIDRVARSPARTVLIYGETGTGKSLVARKLHNASARASHKFVDVNCAAIPSSLLESELFGHERGAFTGAVQRKSGLVEVGNRGTVFLDEILEMGLDIQAKLLSALDTQRFRRIGGIKEIEVDVRFVAATNRILLTEVRKGKFREDLYYRLQVIAINVPPLRERGDDVFVLTDHFLRQLNTRYASYGRQVRGLDTQVEEVFRLYRWPGNVRELQNLLERIFIIESEQTVRLEHIPPRILRHVDIGVTVPPREPWATASAPDLELDSPPDATPVVQAPDEACDFQQETEHFQRELIRRALIAADGVMGAAARRLGISRHALRHHMNKLGIREKRA
jgi:two-component system response regulator AtoC